MSLKSSLLSIFLISSLTVLSQKKAIIQGKIKSQKEAIAYAFVFIKNGTNGTYTDENGHYSLEVDPGEFVVQVSIQGYRNRSKFIKIRSGENQTLDFELIEDVLGLDEVVVSATRNRVAKRKAPVVVSTLETKLLTATQSLSLADGLNFAPGIRVEANCQNCGFTQVRLNGLEGGYTQVLLNSRPVFSSLLGVYGLEQIPTNIIEKIEVVRSGGSALYGSSAIAGTVNVITKDPVFNSWEIGSNLAMIGGEALDRVLTFNNSVVSDDLNSGITLFGTYRNRDSYDANGDGFTELVALKNTTIGAKAFLKPNERSRISLNLNAIQEYRRGGDRLDLAPQFTDITEELDHDTFIGGADYEINSKDKNVKLQIYTSASYTQRDSYYGGLGGARTRQDSILANNAFGKTKDLAWVNGVQYTKKLKNSDVLTLGSEYNHANTEDVILGYNRVIDQTVNSIGTYAQYEWNISDKLSALIGARFDKVHVSGDFTLGNIVRNVDVNQAAFSPRFTLSYELSDNLKLRGGYARGFRAAQAFNEDLHISSVGGEPQFVIVSENLNTEYSDAFTGSFNFSKNIGLMQMDFLVEGFLTSLQNPFTLVSTGAVLSNGSIIEEVRNGSGAKVFGTNFEFALSPNPAWSFQLGGTIQGTRYDEPQILFESNGRPGESDIIVDEFVRNPNMYGYINASWMPSSKFNIDLTSTFTGPMIVPFVVSDSGFLQLNQSASFFDLNLKFERHFNVIKEVMTTLSFGVRNLFNNYQDDFDIGPTRDSDYVYGPIAPRTIFVGVKFGKLRN